MTITQSPGIAVGSYVAGGGRARTTPLRDTIQRAAEALAELYGGANVHIRINSNGLSGGAFLETHDRDGIGANAEVGITAGTSAQHPDRLHFGVMLKPSAAQPGTISRDTHSTVESAEAAISYLRANAILDAQAIRATIRSQVQDYNDRHLRLALLTDNRGSGPSFLVVAENTDEGRGYLERIQRSSSKLGQLFPRYMDPAVLEVMDGVARLQTGHFRTAARVPWEDATRVALGTVYELEDGVASVAGEIRPRKRS